MGTSVQEEEEEEEMEVDEEEEMEVDEEEEEEEEMEVDGEEKEDDGCLDDNEDDDEPQPGPSSYGCQHCTSRFANVNDLQRHESKVHPQHRSTANQELLCPHCSYRAAAGLYGKYTIIYTHN